MQITNNTNSQNFTGFKFSPAAKEAFYGILERENDIKLTNKCLGLIRSQKDNPVPIDVYNISRIGGLPVNDALKAYVNGKYAGDNFYNSIFSFLKKLAKKADKEFLNPLYKEAGLDLVKYTKTNEKLIGKIDELI